MTALPLIPVGLGGFAIAWGFMGIAFWILVIALIVFLVRATRSSAGNSGLPAVRLLEERYARGEISREDFIERRACSAGSPAASPRTTANQPRSMPHR
jgi:putative membrane protein